MMMLKWSLISLLLMQLSISSLANDQNRVTEKLDIAVVGLVHDHVHWILGREEKGDINMVAIVEPNRQLAQKYATRYGYSMEIVYPTLEDMYAHVQPKAVTAFNSIYDHLAVVEFCAPRGIHVMVEKPLAVSVDHVQKMQALAKKHHIHLLTNYETTWYSSHAEAYDKVLYQKEIGEIKKIIFYTGHQGPREIGCSEEFLSWLTDPVQNGAGALTDFGCYGANLATWFLEGKVPQSIFCEAKQYKPEIYPKVDDDASILLQYDGVEVLILASWNWPYGRKEMTIYGTSGMIHCANNKQMQLITNNGKDRREIIAPMSKPIISDPFNYLFEVLQNDFKESAYNLSSLENNATVVRILHGAKKSANEGRIVQWAETKK